MKGNGLDNQWFFFSYSFKQRHNLCFKNVCIDKISFILIIFRITPHYEQFRLGQNVNQISYIKIPNRTGIALQKQNYSIVWMQPFTYFQVKDLLCGSNDSIQTGNQYNCILFLDLLLFSSMSLGKWFTEQSFLAEITSPLLLFPTQPTAYLELCSCLEHSESSTASHP